MYVSKHKHKEHVRTFGDLLKRLEAVGKRLNAFRPFWERMKGFGRQGRLVSMIPYVSMYLCMVSIITKNKALTGSASWPA